mmetsp:Transcript_89550/g.240111  ORF Transcript_89550/g.240111 Transcript_89550/m.240111 type:complete len:220 (-) Transcript_89550:501-1160(-)
MFHVRLTMFPWTSFAGAGTTPGPSGTTDDPSYPMRAGGFLARGLSAASPSSPTWALRSAALASKTFLSSGPRAAQRLPTSADIAPKEIVESSSLIFRRISDENTRNADTPRRLVDRARDGLRLPARDGLRPRLARDGLLLPLLRVGLRHRRGCWPPATRMASQRTLYSAMASAALSCHIFFCAGSSAAHFAPAALPTSVTEAFPSSATIAALCSLWNIM